jgi:hypothetical protein
MIFLLMKKCGAWFMIDVLNGRPQSFHNSYSIMDLLLQFIFSNEYVMNISLRFFINNRKIIKSLSWHVTTFFWVFVYTLNNVWFVSFESSINLGLKVSVEHIIMLLNCYDTIYLILIYGLIVYGLNNIRTFFSDIFCHVKISPLRSK